jgi:hypothetical protein
LAVESKFGDRDAVGFSAGQSGLVVGGRVTFGEVLLAPDARVLPDIDVIGAVTVVASHVETTIRPMKKRSKAKNGRLGQPLF